MFYLRKIFAVIENEKLKNAMGELAKKTQEQGLLFQYYQHEQLQEMEDCLWVTDSEKAVKVLHSAKQPVLAVLHEDNRNLDFSAALYACEEPEQLDVDYLDKVYRRYKQIPWEILQTDRCVLRESIPEDAEAFFEIYKEPSITEYMEGLFPELKQEKQYIQDYINNVYHFYDFGIWTVLEKNTGDIIGRVGLTYREGFEEPEIGFVIDKKRQRKGYAEEVCRAVLEYGREELGFMQVQALVHPQNKASLALCRKLGMQNAGEVMISKDVYVCMKIYFYAS